MEKRRSSVEDLRLMLVTVSDDMRVILTILCDRCCVLGHLSSQPLSVRRRVCQEVLDLFAPITARLGIYTLKQRLERDAFPVVYGADAERIGEQLHDFHGEFGDFLPRAGSELGSALRAEGITATIEGREKQPYSIFLKMRDKSTTHIESVYDLFALRVVVSTIPECYQVLGILHRIGHPVVSRFKDFIAFPKPNGYQSLHTTMAKLPGAPEGVFVEVQVRTKEMHREAEYGIAAHWSYKERGTVQQMVQRVALTKVLATQQPLESGVGMPVLVDHIFVLTPKGDIVELPEGATALDFAFQIHTDLGLTFRTARVNGTVVPLDHTLENGDVVEIFRHKLPQPSPDWLQLLKVASSRARLRRYLASTMREELIAKGRTKLNAEFARRKLPLLDPDFKILAAYDGRMLSLEQRCDLLVKIGQGADRASAILRHLDRLPRRVSRIEPVKIAKKARPASGPPVIVDGGMPMPLKYAKCCKPLEGDKSAIVGFVSRKGAVIIHRQRCRLVGGRGTQRRIGVKWRE
jgi:GTP pyrophosphokinase